MQNSLGSLGVGDVVRQRPGLHVGHGDASPFAQVHLGDRLDVPFLVEEVRAEERPLRLLEEEARVPAVWQPRSSRTGSGSGRC